MQDETPQLTPQPILPAPATVPPKPANKTALIMIATAVAVLLFIGVSLWLWSGAAKSDFTKSTATYLQKAKEAYDYYRDTEKPSSHVDDIIAKFDAAIATKPQVPQVLGVAPADAGDVEKVNTITTQLTNLREDFSAYHQYEAYGQAVLKIMGTSTASISTIDDLRAAKPLFSQAATKLQALGTPKGAGTFQSALEKAYTNMASDIDTAISAYEKGDTANYVLAVQKLANDSKATSINKATTDLNKLYESAYDTLISSYAALAKTVGEGPVTQPN